MTHIREAFTNLITAKLRSSLAILGVLVGTGSVVALISCSLLATDSALSQFKSLGTNLLSMSIQPAPGATKTEQREQLTLKQMPVIKKASQEIKIIAPFINLYQSIHFKGTTFSGSVIGATENFATVAKVQVAKGRFISYLDKRSFYCVIGSKLADKMRAKGVNPLNKQIQIGKNIFTIIGIVKPWKPNLFIWSDINDGVIIPLQTSYVLSSSAKITQILFRLIEKPNLKTVQDKITNKLKQLLPDDKVDFRNPEQIIKIVAKQRETFTWLLGAIGGISLLVGGIGVMNIMLVSVVERRREIGIRMAIGARRSDILQMFLIEAIILTLFGGIFGIALGVSVSYVMAIITKWHFTFFIEPPVLGFVVSVLVGIISGYYPALRASKLDPIKTLQSD